MENTRAALVANAAWIATTVWVAFIVLRAAIVAEGNPVVVASILSGPNLIGAATAAAAAILVSMLSAAAPVAIATGVFGSRVGLPRAARASVFLLGLVGLSILLFTASVVVVALTVLSTVIGIAVVAIQGWRFKKRTGEDGTSGDFRTLWRIAIVYVTFLMFGTVMGGHWVQPERVEWGAQRTVAYFVSQDNAWTTFLTRADRNLLVIPTAEIDQREFCGIDAEGLFPRWVSVPFARVESARLPDCDR